MESGTAALRKAAPEWSLAGDRNLLQVLEEIHQKLMTKCQEVNTKLDDMVNQLDNASVDLQNVNNKFLALSNSQFIESRVYDDDITSEVKQEKNKDEPVNQENELSKLKHSLQTFERMHEAVRILDSDSSDDEDDFSMILKPKDMYSNRPLPYIIGSQQWKTKWHVGLAPSDSDSDSSGSLVKRSEPREQYSESDSEDEGAHKHAARPQDSEFREPSFPESGPRKMYGAEKPGATPVFSEEPPPTGESWGDSSDIDCEEDDSIFASLHRRPSTHRQSKPRAVHPFADQLVGVETNRDGRKKEGRVSSSRDAESEARPGPSGAARPADVAAQIARRLAAQQPALETEPREPSVPESGPRKMYRAERPGTIPVFSEEPPPLDKYWGDANDYDCDEDDSIFASLHRKPSNYRESDSQVIDPFVDKIVGTEINRDRRKQEEKISADTPISVQDSKENLLPQPEAAKSDSTGRKEQTVKKPVGGMSLFGSSQGAESIGAAILKRNQRKLSTSDDEESAPKGDTQPSLVVKPVPTSTNQIIEDLFAKPKSSKNESVVEKVSASAAAEKYEPKPKVDLFSDNIFDDVDDIFTSEIVTKPKKTHQKSIFDDDDLFADVPTKTVVKDNKKNSIFDSDDELFKEDVNESASNSNQKHVVTNKNETSEKKNIEASIFSEDNDIFITNNLKVQHIETASKTLNPNVQPKKFESPLLFDDDDNDDLFISNMKAIKIKESKVGTNENEQDFDNKSLLKTTGNSNENTDKTSEQQHLCVHNAETDEYLFNVPKSPSVKENTKNRLGSIDGTTKEPDNYTNKEDTFVPNKIENVKNMAMDETFDNHKNTNPIADANNCAQNAPIDDNVNSLDDNVNTTNETFSSFIERGQKYDELDDLFIDVPPAFERPSEPKKSKNVNALFDDDSDDEALFFRKSDVSVEKPKELYNDDRFRIFHDEPPDVDVDFTTKIETTSKNVLSDEDWLSSPTSNITFEKKLLDEDNLQDHTAENVKLNQEKLYKDDDLFTKTQDSLKASNVTLDISNILSSENIETGSTLKTEESATEKPIPNTLSEKNCNVTEIDTNKSVGKLKPINININVHSLLPGASPTKQKSKDESDGSAFSSQSNEELNKYSSEKEESKMVKSVSFDGDPGSAVLDNKLSKGRARIQVKRRPSSRRARLEAVRKSGIDFADDSTDNSSSFDGQFSEKEEVPVNSSSSDIVNIRKENIVKDSDVVSNKKLGNAENNISNEMKSRTVYILHDEDIFSNSPNTKTEHAKKSLTIVDDDDEDLFKNPSSTSAKLNKVSEKPNENIEKDKNKKDSENNKDEVPKTTKSIFDDLSDDDELFGGKKSSESNSSKSKNINKVKENLASIKTGSLFGDDSDDDDLFKTAKKTEIKTTQPKETATVKSSAIKDPLSLFDDS